MILSSYYNYFIALSSLADKFILFFLVRFSIMLDLTLLTYSYNAMFSSSGGVHYLFVGFLSHFDYM